MIDAAVKKYPQSKLDGFFLNETSRQSIEDFLKYIELELQSQVQRAAISALKDEEARVCAFEFLGALKMIHTIQNVVKR